VADDEAAIRKLLAEHACQFLAMETVFV
jgi:hypothetical protein